MKHKCDPKTCPIPMCQLPEVLSAQQIRVIMAFKNIPYKEIAFQLSETLGRSISLSAVWAMLNKNRKHQANIQEVSDYMRRRLLEKM